MNFPATVPINYSNTAVFYPDDTGTLGSFTKAPDANTMVTLDYTSLMTELGLTIVSLSFVLNYGSAPQLVVSGASIQAQNTVANFLVSGGLNGLKYVIQVNAALSDGQTTNVQYLEVVVSAPGSSDGCCDPGAMRIAGGPPISTVFQQASILNGDNTRFGSAFVVFWVSDQAPTTANILDRWYNTQDGLIYDRVTDGYSVFWVSSASRPPAYTTGPSTPTNPVQGDMWFNTALNQLNIYINTGQGLNWYILNGV